MCSATGGRDGEALPFFTPYSSFFTFRCMMLGTRFDPQLFFQRADNVAVFRVDRNTGGLRFTGHYAPVGNPSMVAFVDLAQTK